PHRRPARRGGGAGSGGSGGGGSGGGGSGGGTPTGSGGAGSGGSGGSGAGGSGGGGWNQAADGVGLVAQGLTGVEQTAHDTAGGNAGGAA
ncbi:MAG TPA: hypothetical protein VFP72_08280, partial [Kineosporiaceae bacterium]|nr:hypothetical protein [Kineosporiaceae bacterium]